MAPQPREWFAGVEDETILRLLDPLQPGTPDTASSAAWREHIRSAGRTPNGIWGGKLMWNQTPLLMQRAAGLPDRTGDTLRAAIRDVIGSEPVYVHVYRPDVVSQAVSFWRAVQTRVWRGRPDPDRDSRAKYHAGAIAQVVTIMREQQEGWHNWLAEEHIAIRLMLPIRCCGAPALPVARNDSTSNVLPQRCEASTRYDVGRSGIG